LINSQRLNSTLVTPPDIIRALQRHGQPPAASRTSPEEPQNSLLFNYQRSNRINDSHRPSSLRGRQTIRQTLATFLAARSTYRTIHTPYLGP